MNLLKIQIYILVLSVVGLFESTVVAQSTEVRAAREKISKKQARLKTDNFFVDVSCQLIVVKRDGTAPEIRVLSRQKGSSEFDTGRLHIEGNWVWNRFGILRLTLTPEYPTNTSSSEPLKASLNIDPRMDSMLESNEPAGSPTDFELGTFRMNEFLESTVNFSSAFNVGARDTSAYTVKLKIQCFRGEEF